MTIQDQRRKLRRWFHPPPDRPAALYDAGWPGIETALRELRCGPADLTAVVLMRAHPDHLGADEHARKACNATAYLHASELARGHGVHAVGRDQLDLAGLHAAETRAG